MKRFHVHVAVDDLAENIRFYSHLFGAPPSVRKPDYAKWMLDDPRINFAISRRGRAAGIDHLGIQVESEEELAQMRAAADRAAMPVVEERGVACCYARSDKHWVTDPQGVAWETYRTLDTVPTYHGDEKTTACCSPQPGAQAPTRACCG